jgi:hypothetical protein
MPQEIRVTDEAGNWCIYVAVNPLNMDPLVRWHDAADLSR